MNDDNPPAGRHQRWAQLRFAVIGPLLASPPAAGRSCRPALRALAATRWLHPVQRRAGPLRVSTIERWYYRARRDARTR